VKGPAKSQGRTRRWLGALLFVALAGAGAAVLLRPSPPIEVDVVRVERGSVREMIVSAASGEVLPARRVTVRAEIAGTVAEVKKRRGDRVAAGELLVRFDSDELEARVSQSKANVESADVALDMAKTRVATAQRGKARADKLSTSGAISVVELDRADTELAAAKHAVDQASAARRQADAALKLARLSLDRAWVKAPYAGVLQDVFAEVGVQVAPGTALFDLIDDSEIYVSVPIDEADASRVHIDQTVYLQIDAARNESITGKVRFIPTAVGKSNAASPLDPTQAMKRDRFLYVEVTPDRATELRVGSSVNSELLVSEKQDVVYVPTHVVIGRGIERRVYVIESGRARQRSFKAGLTSWERTEVLSGLAEGAVVVASLNAKGLSDGARVAVRRELERREPPDAPVAGQ
jgi:RND family efflux transporter MFP subunit